ncbi:DUF6603 domain-containing protein [Streptomyces hilarionis]|uniref:DUF6603 domain-containing protein n=1 Tax=Streptomyces hilarionis TaxID=2839954 RepID=UPI00211A7C5B|nr:DUF6603 domain-containing protein [Streptomyces hilarionis]MCQ9131156.1 hypothetical protein [Streptomyces hilarionis]
MAGSPGEELLAAVRTQCVVLLDAARRSLESAGRLEPLTAAGDEWAGTALAPHLLQRLPDVDAGQPGVAALLRGLGRLGTPEASGGPVHVGLHGWDAAGGPGQGRGPALALRVDTPGGTPLAAAVAVTGGPAGPLLWVVASGSGAAEGAVVGADGDITCSASGTLDGRLLLTCTLDGTVEVVEASPGDNVSLTLSGRPADLLAARGVGLRLGDAALQCDIVVGAEGGAHAKLDARLPAAALVFDTGMAQALLGRLELPVGFSFGLAEGGARLNDDPGLKVSLPTPGPIGPLAPKALAAILGFEQGAEALTLRLGFEADVRTAVSAVPAQAALDGLTTTLPVRLGAEALGPDLDGITGGPPDGVSIAVTAGPIAAAGLLDLGRPGEYTGALVVRIPPMSVSAFGVLGLPDTSTGTPLSFLVVLGVRFPLPGIQVGFGFAVSGVGGILGAGRRIDRDALMAAVADGRAAPLLFPADPGAALATLGDTMSALFPACPGRFVVGPMFELSWGGRLLRLALGVVAELSVSAGDGGDAAPPRFTVLGKLTLMVPDEVAPLITVQATLMADIDIATPAFTAFANLTGSQLAGLPLTGDLYLLVRGGSDPAFVFSAGGLHPAYRAPAGVPALRRIGMRLGMPLVELRCEAYVAVTSNSVQFGARVELSAELAECGLSGHFGFDALFEWDPFHFSVHASAAVAVEVMGETLMGVSLDLLVEGPAPWRLKGTGRVETFLFDVPFSIDETWGGPPPVGQPPPRLGDLLAAEFAKPQSWRAQAAPEVLAGVQLTQEAADGIAAGTVVHPLGTLQVRQRLMPLEVPIDRFAGAGVPRQTWSVSEPRLVRRDAQAVVSDATDIRPVTEQFALGQFQTLSHEEQLSRPAFQDMACGVTFGAGGLQHADGPRTVTLEWEVKSFVAEGDEALAPLRTWDGLSGVQQMPLGERFRLDDWLRPPDERVETGPQPLTTAFASDVAPTARVADTPSFAAEAQARALAATLDAAASFGRLASVSVVETWELV